MRRGYNTSEVDDLLVWVPETLLPAGMVQLLTKRKPKHKVPFVQKTPTQGNLQRSRKTSPLTTRLIQTRLLKYHWPSMKRTHLYKSGNDGITFTTVRPMARLTRDLERREKPKRQWRWLRRELMYISCLGTVITN